ncbi:MAG TPA: hypothetical protein VIN72_00600 [Lutibacter sp.]
MTEIKCQPHIQVHLLAPTHGRPLRNQKSLNFANTQTRNMETINLIGSICSILGLLIAIFLTTQVVSIKNKLTDNSTNKVKQEKNKVKNGDIAGRDVNK